jgi:hypothetical protein
MTNRKAALIGAATLFGLGILAYTLELWPITGICMIGVMIIVVTARPH